MIEAMACGTPVIAFASGSVPEIVEHGVTGLIVEDEAAAVEAINELSRSCRATAIRARFEQRFTARRMANDYLDIYRRTGGCGQPRPLRTVNGSAKSASHGGRHQTGIDGEVYIGD